MHEDKVVVLLHSVSQHSITAANTELPGGEKPQSSFSVKQALTLKSYSSEVVEDVHFRGWVVIQIVANRRRKLCDLAAFRSRSLVRRASHVEPRADNSHVNHWSNSELLVAPAICVHRAKGAQPEIGGGVKVCYVGLAPEREAPRQRVTTVPAGLRILALKFVFAAFRPVGVLQLKPELVTKIEVLLKRNDGAVISV